MAFDKGTMQIKERMGVIIEGLQGSEQSMLDLVFPRVEVQRTNYTEDVRPIVGLPKNQGKLADGAESQPRKASIAQITGKIDGRYEGSYRFTESERRELQASSLRMERWIMQCRVDATYNIDRDLESVLTNPDYFNAFTRTGADYTNPSAPLVADLLAIAKVLGRRSDLVVMAGVDVQQAWQQNEDVLARTSNYAAGFAQQEELRSFIRGLGFRDFINPERGAGLGKDVQDGVDFDLETHLVHPFEGLVWVGRPDAIYNVEQGKATGDFNFLPATKEYLMDYRRYLDIKPVFADTKEGGMFITDPLG